MVDAFMSSVEKGYSGMTMCEMIRVARNETDLEEVSGNFLQYIFIEV